MWYFLVLILAVAGMDSFSSAAASQPSRHKRSDDEGEPWKNPKLPNTIEPTFYDLHIGPRYLSDNTEFFGNVSIDVNVLNQTKFIIVHTKTITLRDWRAYYTNGSEIGVTGHFYWPKNDYYVMKTRDFMPAKVKLVFRFQGNMTFGTYPARDNSSLYNIPYAKEAGVGSWLVVSDFRSIKARLMFPCFDEPRFKTPIKLTVRHWHGYTALSNMPMEKQENPDSAQISTVFKLSPNMSIHNLGFAITDFPFKNKTVDGKLYRVFAQPKSLDKVDYALSVSPTIVKFLQEELDVPFPPEKLDQLAVSGSLFNDLNLRDNGGLVMFSESVLLFNSTHGDDSAKFLTLRHVARGLAHSYFGHLVTARHWQHIWMTEGLATFYEVRAVKEIEPNFLRKSQFYGMLIEEAMLKDSKNLGSALIPPYDPSTAGNPHFPQYKLLKAVSILRMLENFIGPPAFKSGVSEFLKKYANGNVVTDDLWEILREESGNCYDIKEIMTNWVERKGMPVVMVELTDGNKINATQKQFLDDTPLNETSTWYIPLYYQAKGGNKNLVWMNKTDALFQVPDYSSGDWIIFNYDSTGYYRVNYDANLWGLLAKQLYENHTVFTDLSRIIMISDACAFARAEQLRYDVFLNLTRYASKEANIVCWLKIFEGISDLNRVLRTAGIANYEKFLLNLTSDLMDKYQVKYDGNLLQIELRSKLIELSCHAGHPGCIANSTRLFRAWIQDQANFIPVDYRREVYCTAIANSVDEAEWTTTLERYRVSTMNQRPDLLKALSCTKNVTLLERLLWYSLNTSYVSTNQSYTHVFHVATNPRSENCAWKWLKANHAEIDRITNQTFVGKLLPFAVQHFSTQAQYQQVIDFYAVYPNVTAQDKGDAKGYIDSNIRWYARNMEAVRNWLAANVQS